jgi:YD repeat-containing protein
MRDHRFLLALGISRGGLAAFAIGAGVLTSPALAASTTTYSYDALGRLTKAETSGTVNNGATVTISYDAADNRVTYQVVGAASRVVVVPLNGLTVIPIPEP